MKKFTIQKICAAIVLSLVSVPAMAGSISVKGSDTMVVLGQKWAEAYMAAHPATTLQVTGGGSGTGISALINGTTDVCQSSRPIKDAEKEKLRERFSTTGVEVPVAKDGLSVYVNAATPVDELTLDQVKQIFQGKVTNWKDVGGPDLKITPYSRENSSGTYVFFKDVVLKGGDFSPRAQTLPGTAAVVNAVARDKTAIGYGGAAYAKGIKVLRIKKDAGSPAIAPNAATVKDGSYALARNLFFYVRNKPTGEIKEFIDWVLSAQGQAVVVKVGYFPIH